MNMENVLNFIKDERRAFIELIDGLTVDQLNEVPAGFNNNIIWNFGHIVVTTQALSYLRTGVRTDASFIKYFSAYAKGTKPTYAVDAEEIAELKGLALQTIDQLAADYQAGVFAKIQPFATDTFKATLSTIEEVLITTAGHDTIHYGYAMAQKRIINNK